MIHKKGSADDPTNYECTALLNHTNGTRLKFCPVQFWPTWRHIVTAVFLLQDWLSSGICIDRGCRTIYLHTYDFTHILNYFFFTWVMVIIYLLRVTISTRREFTFHSMNLNENYTPNITIIYSLLINLYTLLLLTWPVFIIESIMKISRLSNNRVSYC